MGYGMNSSQVISDVNRVAMDWARDHAGERLGTKWYEGESSFEPSEKWPVSESVRLAVRKIMTDAFSRLVLMRELVGSIRIATGFPDERAKLIAQTEIRLAQSHGNLAAWKRTGVVRSTKWLKSSLHTVRDACDLNVEAGGVPIGQPFPSGDECPPAHIGCCCVISPAEIVDPTKKH
jgi:hypothetical protein